MTDEAQAVKVESEAAKDPQAKEMALELERLDSKIAKASANLRGLRKDRTETEKALLDYLRHPEELLPFGSEPPAEKAPVVMESPLMELGIPTRAVNALEKVGITTIAELEAKRAEGQDWWQGIKGFGVESATAVDNAVIEFLAERQDAPGTDSKPEGGE